MVLKWRLRHKLLLAWGLALAFALGMQVSVASALDSSCESQCAADCGAGNCSGWQEDGCSCFWICSNGSRGKSICV